MELSVLKLGQPEANQDGWPPWYVIVATTVILLKEVGKITRDHFKEN